MISKTISLDKPIPPLSVVRLAFADVRTPRWLNQVGKVFRVGYYSQQDGLDCVWLVNDDGKYEQATDHKFLYRYFDIIHRSGETSLHGRRRPKIPPIRRAG
jgi:hypothetical protein